MKHDLTPRSNTLNDSATNAVNIINKLATLAHAQAFFLSPVQQHSALFNSQKSDYSKYAHYAPQIQINTSLASRNPPEFVNKYDI